MIQTGPHVSRRRILCLFGAVPVALGALGLVGFSTSPEQALRRAIARMPLPFPGRLELVRFEERAGQEMQIVLRLTWPPGMRQRPFKALGQTPEANIAALSGQIENWVGTLS